MDVKVEDVETAAAVWASSVGGLQKHVVSLLPYETVREGATNSNRRATAAFEQLTR